MLAPGGIPWWAEGWTTKAEKNEGSVTRHDCCPGLAFDRRNACREEDCIDGGAPKKEAPVFRHFLTVQNLYTRACRIGNKVVVKNLYTNSVPNWVKMRRWGN